MLKRFVPQRPAPPIREEPRTPVPDDNNHLASREESAPKPTTIDNSNPKPNPMADHGGKDILSSDVEIKSITVYGKVHGNITVGERCELKSKCVLQGDLKAARLVIEEGATFIGKSEVTTGAYSAKAAQRPEVVRSSEPVLSSSVSNVNANSRSLAPQVRQSAPHAARILICAITKSSVDSVEAFALAATCIFRAKAIWPAVVWFADRL